MSVLISIIIPCRNEARHIGECLASVLAQQPVDGGFEVIVADGLSDDGTRAILAGLAERDPRLRVIDNPGRIVSTGLNAAIRSARGEIIIRMDAHTEYAPDYVRECVAVLDATGADNVGGPLQTKAEGYMSRAICAAIGTRFAAGGTRPQDTSYDGEFDTVIYGCWRKEFLLKTGLFNEELVRNQDDELSLRITGAGGRLWQSPRIRSWYRPRSSLVALGRQYFLYGYWKVRVIQLHRRIASPRHVVPVLFTLGVSLGWLAGFAHPSLWGAYVGALALYAAASLLFAARTARLHGWDLLPALPLVFLTFHLGYGGGFACGVWDFAIRGPARLAKIHLACRSAESRPGSLRRVFAAPFARRGHAFPPDSVPGATSMIKRAFDLVAASLGLVALSPLLGIVAVVVRLSSPGPILFRQIRVGLNGGDFSLFKFRTMTARPGSEAGTFDLGDNSRVTTPGRHLRAWKLDELPQLWNVLRGDMSMVGPRPEVRKWVQSDPGRWSVVHSVRPGITDPAAIVYRHEERMLAKVPDPEAVYRERILPRKLDLYCQYVSTRTFRGDLWILIRTMIAIARFRGPTSIEA